MPKLLKYLLVAVGVLVSILIVAIAIIAATFDANAYKPQLIQLVQDKTQRTLAIPGEISLTLFPKIGADLGQLTLSERNGNAQFAGVKRAQVSLELLPMLSKRFVVDRISVDGLVLNITKSKEGTTNVDDLISPADGAKDEAGGTGQQVQLDIDGVSITDASLSYQDQQAGRSVSLTDLDLSTGPIANGKSSTISLTGNLTESSTKSSVRLDVKSGMTLDLEKKHYVIKGLDGKITGQAMGYDNLKLTATGNADIEAGSSRFALRDMRIGVAGKQTAQAIDLNVAIPELSLTSEKISGSGLTGSGRIASGQRTTDLKLAAPAFSGSQKAFSISTITLDATINEPTRKISARLAGPLQGELEKKLFRSPEMVMTLDGQQDNLPIKGSARTALTADMTARRIELGNIGIDLLLPNPRGGTATFKAKGSASADLAKEAAQAVLTGTLDGADFGLQMGMAGFTTPAYKLDARIASLDLDRYMKQETKPAGAQGGGVPSTPQAETKAEADSAPAKPIDLAALKNLNATANVQIGSLKISNIKASNVRAELRAGKGRADIAPLSANLYGGNLNGSLSAIAGDQPRFIVKQSLSDINIGPLLKDIADKDILDGRGKVVLDLTTAGGTANELKKAVGGSAQISLADGAIRGVNIASVIRQAKEKIGGASGAVTGTASQQGKGGSVEKTDFTALTGSFRIANGVARNDDLDVKSPLLRITGAGDVNIGQDRLDYVVKATVVSTLQGQGGPELQALRGLTVPVRLVGPYDAIAWNVDVAGMATALAKAKIDEKKGEVLNEVQKNVDKQKGKIAEELGGRLKGLLGK